MPAYKYEALDANGKSSTGIVEAETMKAARSHLRGLQLVPLGLVPVAVSEASGGQGRLSRKAFSSSGLAVWTRQLAGLVGSGLPLERALTALSDEAENRYSESHVNARSQIHSEPGLVFLCSETRVRSMVDQILIEPSADDVAR